MFLSYLSTFGVLACSVTIYLRLFDLFPAFVTEWESCSGCIIFASAVTKNIYSPVSRYPVGGLYWINVGGDRFYFCGVPLLDIKWV